MEETPDSIEPTAPTPATHAQPDLVIGAEAKYFLHTAGRWANFLGILGFVFTGLLALEAIFIGTIMTAFSKFTPLNAEGDNPAASIFASMSGFLTFIYLLIAVIYFFFSFYLYKFGTEAKSGTTFNNQLQLNSALKNLKSFFKLWGITSIVIIVLGILTFIGAIIFAVSMGSAMGNSMKG